MRVSPVGRAASGPASFFGGDHSLSQARPPCGGTPNKVPPLLAPTHTRPLGTLGNREGLRLPIQKAAQVNRQAGYKVECVRVVRRGRRLVHKVRRRACTTGPTGSRFLQHLLCGPQERRRPQAYPKPEAIQQVTAPCKVQNGNIANCHSRGPAGQLASISRLEGRVPTRPSGKSHVEVSEVLPARCGRFPVASPPIRPVTSPVRVHPYRVHSRGLAQVSRDTPSRVSGRPPPRRRLPTRGPTSSAHDHAGLDARFIINLKKSDLVPTQELVYIGALLSPLKGQVLLPVDRRAALIRALSSFSRVGALHSTRLWMQVIGLMAATIQCVPDARLRMRPIQWHVKNRWTSGSFDQLIMVTCKVREALLWWTCPLNLAQGLPLDPPSPQLTVTTDASIEGWGGHSLVQGQTLLFSGIWSPHERAHCHINLLELRAIRLTLMKLRDCIRGLTVKVECDNTTAVSYLNKQGGTISQSLCQEAVILHEWARQMDVHLIAVHRPGVCNELADYLSRNRPDPTEWSLAQQSYNLIVSRWGQPQLDLFASPANHKAALWFSRLPHPGAAAVDAFNQSTSFSGRCSS